MYLLEVPQVVRALQAMQDKYPTPSGGDPTHVDVKFLLLRLGAVGFDMI